MPRTPSGAGKRLLMKISAFLEWNLYTRGETRQKIGREYAKHKACQMLINAGKI